MKGVYKFRFSEKVDDEVVELARRRGTTITELLRLALSLLKVVINEAEQGHKLIVCTADGQPLKELLLEVQQQGAQTDGTSTEIRELKEG